MKRIALLPEFPYPRFAGGGFTGRRVTPFLQRNELHPERAAVSLQPAFRFEEPRPAASRDCNSGFHVLPLAVELLDAALQRGRLSIQPLALAPKRVQGIALTSGFLLGFP